MVRTYLFIILMMSAVFSSTAQTFRAFDDAAFCFNQGASALLQDPLTQRIWAWAVYSSNVDPELIEITANGQNLFCIPRSGAGATLPGNLYGLANVFCIADTVYAGSENALLRSVNSGAWDSVSIEIPNREFRITSINALPDGQTLVGISTYVVVSRDYQSGIPVTVIDSIDQRFAYLADGKLKRIASASSTQRPSKPLLVMRDGTTYAGFAVMKGLRAFMYEIAPDGQITMLDMPGPSATLLQAPTLASVGDNDLLVWFDPSTNDNGYRVNGGLFKYHRPTGEVILLRSTTAGGFCSWSGTDLALIGSNDEITVYRNDRVEQYQLSTQLGRDPMLCSVYGIAQLSPTLWLCNTSGGMVFFELEPVSSAGDKGETTRQRMIIMNDRNVDLRQFGYTDNSPWFVANLLGQQVAQSNGHRIELPEQSGLYMLTNGVDRVVVLAE